MHTFVPGKSSGQLLDISPENVIFLKTFDSEFSYIEVWFTDQNSNPLEIEDKTNFTLSTTKNDVQLISTKRCTATDALKTASKRTIQKTAEATGDLIGNKFLINLEESQKPLQN